jgi:ABC-2 type transport system permease protein
MNASIAPALSLPRAERISAGRIFFAEARAEFLRLLRAPSFAVPTIAFPLMFYVLFGVLLTPGHAHPEAARHALASFVVLGAMAPGLFGLGISLAVDRERGLLQLKRALPVPAGVYLAAKLAMSMLFAGLVALLIMTLAVTVGAVTMSLGRWGELFALAVLGVVPFSALGLLVGSLARASAAPATINLIYLPMSFLSGLWLPLSFLPKGLAALAPLWPSWQLVEIARALVGEAVPQALALHVLALAAAAGVCFALAQRALARSA